MRRSAAYVDSRLISGVLGVHVEFALVTGAVIEMVGKYGAVRVWSVEGGVGVVGFVRVGNA